MNKVRWVIVSAVGVGLLGWGWGTWEHRARRTVEARYSDVVESQQQLKRHYAAAITEHQQLKEELAQEREHGKELSQALLESRAKMEEAVGRLSEETRTVGELQGRLAAMREQMGQLQGELSVALESRDANEASGKSSAQVALDRIVVGQAGTSPLQGHVVSVHPDWNFVVVSLGWDAVKIGEQVSIMRDEKVLAKARVERIQEGVCAATILPEWKINNVNVNDIARAL